MIGNVLNMKKDQVQSLTQRKGQVIQTNHKNGQKNE